MHDAGGPTTTDHLGRGRAPRALVALAVALLAALGVSGGATAATAAPSSFLPVALPVAVPASVTSSGYAPLGDVSQSEAFDGQTSTATAVDRPGQRAALIGALGVGVTGDTPLRAGGSGSVTISLSRQVDRPVVVRDTRLTIALPAGYRSGGVVAPGWTCTTLSPGTIRCSAPRAVAAGSQAAVRLGLVARRAGRAQVRVSASWREGNRARTGRGTATFTVRRPLAVHVTTPRRQVLGDGAGVDSAPLVLTGRLGRHDAGLPVDYRWRVVCATGDCPKLHWDAPTSGRASGAVVTAQVRVPAVRRATRLRFELTARDWRGSARATTSVVVLPQREAHLSPGAKRLKVVPRGTVKTREYVSRLRVTRAIELSGSALAGPKAGQRVRIDATPQGGELHHVRWSVVRGPRALLRGRPVNQSSLSFVVPRGVRQLTIGVRGTVSGRVVRTRATVHVVATIRRPARRAAKAALLSPTGAAARAADTSTFCTLWDAAAGGAADAGTGDAPIALPDGTSITLGDAVASGTDCADGDARIAFARGEVRVGATTFDDVAGTVTAGGVSLTSGWLVLPEGWWTGLPSRLHVEPGSAGQWGAGLSDDAWGPLRARIDLDDGVELLPLPEGWTFPQGQSTLDYVPSSKTFALHSVAQAPAGQGGKVTLDGSITLGGATTVTVDAQKLVTLDGVGADAVALSGEGRLQTNPEAAEEPPAAEGARAAAAGPLARAAHTPAGGASTLTGSLTLRTDPAGGLVPLTSNVALSDVVARWDTSGIDVSTAIDVQTARGTLAATASGQFTSTSQWRLAVRQARPFSLGDGITMQDVEGSIERTPSESGDAAQDAFTVSLTGAVNGWSPSPALTDLSIRGAITNACTDEEPSCSTKQVRLAMEVRGKAHVRDQTVPWYGIAAVNLSTFAIRFEGGAELTDFGPDALHLSNVQLRLTNGGPAWCRPSGASAASAAADDDQQPAAPSPTTLDADQELTFGISASGRVLGQPFQAAGEFASSGYCLTGAFGSFTPDGLTSGGADRPLVDGVRLAYASRAADVTVAGRAIRLGAGDVRLSGELNLPANRLPDQLRDVLGGHADLSLALTRDGDSYGLSGAARFTFAQPVYLLGSASRPDEARLGLTGAELSFDYSAASSLRLEMAAKAALQTPANEARGIPASRTPLFLAAGVNLGTPSVTVSAGVDTTDPALADGTVHNAFGQAGLDVRRLLVSASLGADTSVGIAADATLPDGWTRSLGMPDRTPAKVAFSISQTAPCLELEVGKLPDAEGSPRPQPSILRLGALSASYAQIVVAPTGCTIGNPAPGKPGYRIDPGFAFAFDGQVGPVPVTFAAALRKYNTADFALRGSVRVGAFEAGPVSFRRTSLDLDIDTGAANRHVDVAFSGGLDAGESTIDVQGRFRADANAISASLRGNGRLRFAGTTFAEGSVDAQLDFARTDGSWSARTADVKARTTILGAEAGLLLSYRDGAVATAAGAFQYSASVGPLGVRAGALFAYAPEGVRLDGDPRSCSVSQLTPQKDAKELIVRLCSSMRLGPLSHDSTFTVSLPQRWDLDFAVPRSEVGIYLASVYLQGELHASLQVSLSGLHFWVRSGNARAGGCLNMFFWSKCADGINVTFNPNSGRFEGSFIGIPVSWGSDSWRATPAPSPTAPQEPAVGAGDRVYVARAERATFDTRAGGTAPWRRTTFAPPRGGTVVAGATFDPDRHEITVTLPLTAAARGETPKPAQGYLVTFTGVAFDGSEPRTTLAAPPGGGAARPTIAYTGVEVGRVPGTGESVTATVAKPGTLALTDGGRRLSWNVAAGDRQQATGPLSSATPFNELERELDASVPSLVERGLPLAFALDLAPEPRRVESRAALLRART